MHPSRSILQAHRDSAHLALLGQLSRHVASQTGARADRVPCGADSTCLLDLVLGSQSVEFGLVGNVAKHIDKLLLAPVVKFASQTA